MTAERNNVLLPMALPTRNVLRKALADIVRAIQSQHGLTDEQLAGELDPSTFDYPEQFQMTEADYRLRAWVWRGLAVWCLVMAGLGAWALWALADAVF